jgi:hypothetical protein
MPEPVTIFTPPKNPPVNNSPAAVAAAPKPTPGTVQSSPPMSEPQQRWQADRDAIAAADPWQQSPEKVAMVKGSDGVVRPVARTAGDGTGQPGDQPQPGQAGVTEDGKLVLGDLALSADDVKAIWAAKAEQDTRRATLPETPAKYELALPKDFELPQGVEWKWGVDHPVMGPLLDQAKEFAHANGIGQAGFEKMLSFFVAHQVHEQAMINELRQKEVTKLGAMGPSRVDSIITWLRASVGDQLARSLAMNMFTSDQVLAFEMLMGRKINQGVSGNPGGNRDGAGAGPDKISQGNYDKMSYFEKQQYAAGFKQ